MVVWKMKGWITIPLVLTRRFLKQWWLEWWTPFRSWNMETWESILMVSEAITYYVYSLSIIHIARSRSVVEDRFGYSWFPAGTLNNTVLWYRSYCAWSHLGLSVDGCQFQLNFQVLMSSEKSHGRVCINLSARSNRVKLIVTSSLDGTSQGNQFIELWKPVYKWGWWERSTQGEGGTKRQAATRSDDRRRRKETTIRL